MSSESVPVEAMFSTTGLILNGKRSVLASSIEFHSFMTIFIDFINVDLVV